MIHRYLEYLDACKRRAWDELGRFLAETVLVKRPGTDATRVRGRRRVDDRCFPDYWWELRRVVLEGEWLAVHRHDVGTRAGAFLTAPGDGTRIETDELDMYRIVDGLIHEVEGTADNARLCS